MIVKANSAWEFCTNGYPHPRAWVDYLRLVVANAEVGLRHYPAMSATGRGFVALADAAAEELAGMEPRACALCGEEVEHGGGTEVGGDVLCDVCARLDDETPSVADDLKLYDRLVGSVPLHASPAEHQATPDHLVPGKYGHPVEWDCPEQHGNLVGWVQYRRTLPNESVNDARDASS